MKGARLAFVQGGREGAKLVYLTPPITVRAWDDQCEALWEAGEMPFRYSDAPTLAANAGTSDFPLVERMAMQTACATVEGGLTSRIRSRATALDANAARELIEVYERLRDAAPRSAFAASYEEALPHRPPRVERNRRRAYNDRIAKLAGLHRPRGQKCVESRPARSGAKHLHIEPKRHCR